MKSTGKTNKTNSMRKAALIAAALTISIIGSACHPMMNQLGNGWVQGIITRDGGDDYNHRGANDVSVSAKPGNTGGNFREALIKDGQRPSFDQESCVTWSGPAAGTIIQPGVVLRANTETGRTRLIMVTNNVMYGIRSTVNIHLVDTDWEKAYSQIAGKMTSSVGSFNTTQPLPWRFCAQVTGQDVRAKAWSTSNPEPAWDDDSAVVTATVPASYLYAGKPGIYIGHLRPGQATQLSNHTSRVLDGPGNTAWNRMLTVFRSKIMSVIGTVPSEDTIAEWTAMISQGNTRGAASAIANSAAGRKAENKGLFERALGRTIQNPGVMTQTPLARLNTLTNSAEFKNGASLNSDWVRRLYQRLLGRNPSASEVQNWARQLNSGAKRANVVRGFWMSAENSSRVVNQAYLDLAGRRPSAAEMSEARALFTSSGGDTTLVRAFVMSKHVRN